MVAAALLGVGVSQAPQAKAANLFWDTNSSAAGLGGSGAWDVGVANWFDAGTSINAIGNRGTSPATLSSADIAYFVGTAGTATIGSTINVGGLNFGTTGYTLTTLSPSASSLNFAATENAITLNSLNNANATSTVGATITGTVGGSGNVTVSGGLAAGLVANTLTLNGVSTGGWSGATTVGVAQTIALSGLSQALLNTSAITLSGGSITVTNTSGAEAALNRIANAAAITSNGGSIVFTNTASASINYSETLGNISLASGLLTVTQTNANTSPSTQTLALGSLTRAGSNPTAQANLTGASLGANVQNVVTISGQTATTASIAPWMTYNGSDFAAYNATNGVVAATSTALTASVVGSASTDYSAASVTLGSTGSLKTLKYSGGTILTVTGSGVTKIGGVVSAGAVHVLTGGTSYQSLVANDPLYFFVNANQLTVSAAISSNGTTPNAVVLGGAGTLSLTGTNTFTGNIVLNSGILSYLGNTAATLGNAGNGIIVNGPATLTALTTGGTTARAITLNNGAILSFTNAAIAQTYSGNITGTGGILVNNTSGTATTFSGTNTFTGPVQISSGTLTTTTATALGNVLNPVNFANVAGVTLSLGANTEVGSISGAGGTGGTITLGANTLTFGGNNQNTTYGGTFTGTGGITKTGAGTTTLSNAGSTFTGAVNLNGGLLNVSALAATGNSPLGTSTTISFGGGGIQFGAAFDPSVRTLTFNAGGAVFDTNALTVRFDNAVGGSGAGGLTKTGNGTLLLLSNANVYSGGTQISRGVISLLPGVTSGALGSGAVTVNAGGALRIARPSQIPAAGVTLVSSTSGLGALALGYVGTTPTVTFNANGRPFSGVLGIETVGYNLGADFSTLGGGNAFLGSVGGANAVTGVAQSASANFTGTLAGGSFIADSSGFATAPNAGLWYRLGGGGGVLNLNVSGQLTGAEGNVTFGAAGSTAGTDGTGGTIVLNQANSHGGFSVLNFGQTVQVGHAGAFGTSTLIFNGGTLSTGSFQRSTGFRDGVAIANNVKMAGDVFLANTFNGATSGADLILSGNIGLSNSSATANVARVFTVPTSAFRQSGGGLVTLSGVISDGDSTGNGIIKAGAGPLRLSGANTYTGPTRINGGSLVLSAENQIPSGSTLNINTGILSVWESSFTLNRTVNFLTTGASLIDVADGRTLTQGTSGWAGEGRLIKIGAGTLTLGSANTMAGLTLQHGVVSASADNQLGAGTAGIIFNNAADALAYGTGGIPVLRITSSFSTPRVLTASTAGAIEVTSGNTLTMTGAAATGTLNKLGAGTIALTVTNGSATAWNVNAGVLAVSNSAGAAPLGTNSTTTLNGGTIRITNTGAADYATGNTGTLNINGGGVLALNNTTAFSTQFTFGSIARTGQGTMVIAPTASLGGTTGSRARLIATNLLGAAVASSNFAGIISPTIVRLADAAPNQDADFVTYNTTNGFITGTPTTSAASLTGSQPGSVGSIVAAQSLSGVNSIYAFKTNANVSGGTLQVVSNNTTTQLGGILMNGAGAAAPVISSNLFFGLVNNNVSQLNGINFGEGVVYTSTGFTGGTLPTLSGSVTANNFTKFGPGTLLFSGTNRISGSLAVQSGAVQFSGAAAQPASINLTLNDAGSLDLNGGSVEVAALAGSAGVVTNTSATAGTLLLLGTNATTFTGTIQDGAGSVRVIKGGSATLTLGGPHASASSNPIPNLNTFTGGFVLRSGQVTLNTPTALGFASTGSTALELQGGTLLLQPGGNGPGLATIIGHPSTNGLNVVVTGTGTAINTDNNGGLGGNGIFDQVFQFNSLTLGNSTFSSNPSTDQQSLRFVGNVTGGNASVISVATAIGSTGRSVLELSGIIQDTGAVPFALTKAGTGAIRITGGSSTFTGGTNVLAGVLQVAATSGNPLGTGAVVVYPGATLRLSGAGSTAGAASLEILSSPANLGQVVLDGNFSPDNTTGAFTATSMDSFLPGAVQIGMPNFSGTINLATIGDGRQFLGAFGTVNLGNQGAQFVGALNPGAGSRYRVGANSAAATLLTFAGADNVFSGTNSLEVGAPLVTFSFAVANPTNATGTVVVQNSNNFSGGSIVNRGSSLFVEAGGAEAGSTPLGSGAVEVRNGAVLQYRGPMGSAFNAQSSANANDIRLRLNGTVRLDDTQGLFAGAGAQGRWADGTGITLDGGTFGYSGLAAFNSYEKVGAITLGLGAGTINISRGAAGSAVLEVDSITRGTQRGTLMVTTAGAGTLTAASAFDRLRVATAITNAGSTTNGAGATSGIAPVWMVDATNNTFLSYQGTTLGLQSLLASAPGAGQVAYSHTGTGIASGLTGARSRGEKGLET